MDKQMLRHFKYIFINPFAFKWLTTIYFIQIIHRVPEMLDANPQEVILVAGK